MIIARGHPGYPTVTSVPERLFCVARSMQSHDRIGRSESAIRPQAARLNVTFRDRPCSWLTRADPPSRAAI
jgi:hypothetical protein